MILNFTEEDYSNFQTISLIKFLLKKTNISFVQLKKLFREKKIKVNNKKEKEQYILQTGDIIQLIEKVEILGEVKEDNFLMKNLSKEQMFDIRKNIILEDENLIFFNKKRGICVQGGSNVADSLEDILSSFYKQKIRIVHRIDKETTGIIVFAKNYKTSVEMGNLFQLNKIEKTYFAITDGVPPRTTGTIDREIFYRETGQSKDAITEYEVIEVKKNFSLIKLSPKTGRKHQIRIHLAGIDCPILGDEKYNKNINTKQSQRNIPMQLYAFAIKIPDYKEISITKDELLETFKSL